MKTIFVRLAAIAMTGALLPFAVQAAPVVTGVALFTENRGATSVFSAGHSFILVANATPSGPGTTVTGTHVPGGSGPDYAMSFVPGAGGFLPNQYAIRTPYAGQTGRWDVTATDGTGSTTVRTHNLDDVRALPLVTGLAASGSALTPHLTWNPVDPHLFPSFCGGIYGACTLGYDFFQYQIEVRLVTGTPGNPAPLAYSSSSALYTSIPGTFTPDLTMTQFDIPAGVLGYGNHYLIGIRLNHFDLEGGFPAILENRSTNYVEVTPIPEPETYAMLLAGLGLLGFVARRRKLKEAAIA
jgi:PEP-CTERM motif